MKIDFSLGQKILKDIFSNPKEVETNLLEEIMVSNANTEYGKRYRFSEIKNLKTFQQRLPIVSYEDIRNPIERIMDGEEDILFPGKASFIAQTSGTTSKPKYYPYLGDKEVSKGLTRLAVWLSSIESDHPSCLEHNWAISGKYDEGKSAGGATIGSASGWARQTFPIQAFSRIPNEILECTDTNLRYYSILRLAIADRNLKMINAFNPSTIIMLFDKGLEFSDALIRDLSNGTLKEGPANSSNVHEFFAKDLKPEPEAAAILQNVIQEFGKFRADLIWPKLELFMTWKAAMAVHYLRILNSQYPEVAIRSTLNAATEGVFSIPIKDEWTGGIPAIFETITEWFPLSSTDEPISFLDLELGKEYQLAITNHRGLYRLLMGDVFKVESIYKGLPVVTFSHRKGATSSITGEKLTESQIIRSVDKAAAQSKFVFDEFKVAPEWGQPPRYLMMIECKSALDRDKAKIFLNFFEQFLKEENIEYASKRDSGRLASPEIILLSQGCFENWRRLKTSAKGKSDATVKIARLNRELVDRANLPILEIFAI